MIGLRAGYAAPSAAEIRRKRVDRMRAFTHWRRHLDDVYVRINGVRHDLRIAEESAVLLLGPSRRRP